MTTQTTPQIISLSAELARTDDARRQTARRWHAALHRLCLLRATTNETTYETQWARIFDRQLVMDDLQRTRLLSFAALDVLEIQHDYALMVCRMDGIAYDEQVAEETRELLAALRFKFENGLP